MSDGQADVRKGRWFLERGFKSARSLEQETRDRRQWKGVD